MRCNNCDSVYTGVTCQINVFMNEYLTHVMIMSFLLPSVGWLLILFEALMFICTFIIYWYLLQNFHQITLLSLTNSLLSETFWNLVYNFQKHQLRNAVIFFNFEYIWVKPQNLIEKYFIIVKNDLLYSRKNTAQNASCLYKK